MDVAGAQALRVRIEQQEQWRLAEAVREGRQPLVDPDLHALREFRGDVRVYDARFGSFAKRLVDGAWARVDLS